LQGITN